MFNAKDIIRDSSGGPVNEVLFSEQRRELVKSSDVSVRETDEPLQRRACQCAHKKLAIHNIIPSYEDHLSVERREMSLWSSTPVKVTFGPRDVVGNAVSIIFCDNGMGRALSGMGGARSSTARSPARCNLCAVPHWFCVVLHCLHVMRQFEP